jgi:acyl-homoserine lactone acylase PvdQ
MASPALHPAAPPGPAGRPRGGRRRRWLKRLGVCLGLTLSGLAWIWPPAPGSIDLATRLKAFPSDELPLFGPAEVRWNDQAVPFILAEDERDVPFLLGLVHAHLRRSQMELFRRLARGQLSEMAGPLARPIDQLLRGLDLDRAVPEMARQLPEDTRAWLERYVDGVNLQAERATGRPRDMLWLGIGRRQVWSVEDVLAVARLASADISLGKSLGHLSLLEEPRAAEYLARLSELEAEGRSSFGPEQPLPLSELGLFSKSGSNCFVVSGSRTESGQPILASDPHLGFFLPNFWCLVAYRTPQRTVAGLSVPGVPAVVVGRNQDIAFGGTNMAAYSSALYDVSDLPEADFQRRREPLGTRGWPDNRVELVETPFGPLISELSLLRGLKLPPTALRWRGHEPSDEVSSFLRASHARNWDEYRAAFADYAVAGQNLLFASADGHIGQILALEQVPAAAWSGSLGRLDPQDPRAAWGPGVPSTDLPAALDPPTGYLVSANNTPVHVSPPIVANPNANDRVARISELIEAHTPVTLADAAQIQRDVLGLSAQRCAAALLAAWPAEATPNSSPSVASKRTGLGQSDFGQIEPAQRMPEALGTSEMEHSSAAGSALDGESPIGQARALQVDLAATQSVASTNPLGASDIPTPPDSLHSLLATWDGQFTSDSPGALAYVRLLDALLNEHHQAHWGPALTKNLRGSPAVHDFVARELERGEIPAAALSRAIARATQRQASHPEERTWGDIHQLPLQHPLGRLPLLGLPWRDGLLPTSGNASTVKKSAGPLQSTPHQAFFGAQSRFLADLSDPDQTWFVLLGGQDGYTGSANTLDQVPLFESGQSLQVPLGSAAAIQHHFPHSTPLHRATQPTR